MDFIFVLCYTCHYLNAQKRYLWQLCNTLPLCELKGSLHIFKIEGVFRFWNHFHFLSFQHKSDLPLNIFSTQDYTLCEHFLWKYYKILIVHIHIHYYSGFNFFVTGMVRLNIKLNLQQADYFSYISIDLSSVFYTVAYYLILCLAIINLHH